MPDMRARIARAVTECKRGVTVIVDETPDARGKGAVNVLFRIDGRHVLAITAFPPAVTAATIMQLVVQTVNDYKVPSHRIDGVATDSTAYNVAMFRNLSPLYPCAVCCPRPSR